VHHRQTTIELACQQATHTAPHGVSHHSSTKTRATRTSLTRGIVIVIVCVCVCVCVCTSGHGVSDQLVWKGRKVQPTNHPPNPHPKQHKIIRRGTTRSEEAAELMEVYIHTYTHITYTCYIIIYYYVVVVVVVVAKCV